MPPPILNPLPPPLPSPTPLGCHRALGWAPCVTQQMPTGYLFHICYCICFHSTLSIHPTLSFPYSAHKSVIYVCIFAAALSIGSSVFKTFSPVNWANTSSHPRPSPPGRQWDHLTHRLQFLHKMNRAVHLFCLSPWDISVWQDSSFRKLHCFIKCIKQHRSSSVWPQFFYWLSWLFPNISWVVFPTHFKILNTDYDVLSLMLLS